MGGFFARKGFGSVWGGQEMRGAKKGVVQGFLRFCKLLIYRVYFTGAGCTYIYRYTCTLHQPFALDFN